MKNALIYLASIFTFNTAIAGVLSMYLGPFWFEFIYSQCIGLSVLSSIALTIFVVRPGLMRWVALCITMPAAVALGMTLSFATSGVGSWHNQNAWNTMVIGLFFGLIGAITLLLGERIGFEIEQRKHFKAESEKREIEAHLKLLQAQIEPHFLFNTLANVSSLIDSDPTVAKKLLERLNEWLRVALARARSDVATLGDELDMLENYLQILKVRFGDRLIWRIDVTEDARETAFPPMLLQPLVENAVRHGIEPKIGGGEIGIHARIQDASLHIKVSDTGVGFTNNHASGAGLSNVSARLEALFGDAGKLRLETRSGYGVTATLEFPA
ncbi:histidine kinase [Sideroxydans sp. CL21]|uniref:sensor histidine kinase n=1 Tax=Sideroxydans sp. CL21 TaxID=2600596 RepID=UPI0024BD29A2|nr:histidine kinase [Sideroxydans sp. CL21]